jgi:phosphate acetyltransferase
MSRSVYLTSPEGNTGKSTVAFGLLDQLTRTVKRVGVFRPVTKRSAGIDRVTELLLSHPAVDQDYETAIGISYDELHRDPDGALGEILRRFHLMADAFDIVVVIGSDYTDVSTGSELAFNAGVAANLGSPVVIVISGVGRSPEDIRLAADLASNELIADHAHPVAVIANRVDPEQVDRVTELLAADGGLGVGAIPEVPVLIAPTVRALFEAVDGRIVRSENDEWLDRESMGFVIGAMSLPNVLTRLDENYTVIAPGDRYDLLPGLVLAHYSGTFPVLASIVLTGGYLPPDSVSKLIAGVAGDLPIAVTDLGTFETASTLAAVHGQLSAKSQVKVDIALRVFAESINTEALLSGIDTGHSDATTPLMFQFRLIDRARQDRKHIVLPEGTDDRILEATDSLLRLGVADITILGDENAVRTRAATLGLTIAEATVVSPKDPELVERFAEEYFRLRQHKGMTLEKAREVVTDVSYFGTMMVHLGLADGMVSGAAHTTAHTIRPSFEIVKTVPGTKTVSSVFLMCLSDRVLVYGDCAVIPDPTAEQLADIAISSAATAAQFDVDPRVALLSYSTGTSGTGADVDKVRAATEIVKERRPDLLVEGPIQYDAAVDPSVAASKLPNSQVAGKATVLIFPDLNTGNNTYKAVQRSAGAVAIGPVLQGLNKPVNDLSRGALVVDIVNTVVITAIQAQAAPPVAAGQEPSVAGTGGSA